ncbi:MAG: elongation factor G [Ruminococcaceae bacterium]|nr:elongation factor G [Oscillospiraceae bacterium]
MAITTKEIRNVCLLGHGGSGKTTLAEAMLFAAKDIDRMGKTTDGNTVCDFDPEEIARGYSISTSVASIMWKEHKINIIDTPGYLDFVGDTMEGIRVADAAIIAVDGKAGMEVGTELAWEYVETAKLPRAFFINKLDDPEANFDRVFNQLSESFGTSVCPIFVPVGGGVFVNLLTMEAFTYNKERGHRDIVAMTPEYEAIAAQYKEKLDEAAAQTSEELLEKFFEEGEISSEEAATALHEGLVRGDIVPVFCGCAPSLWGVRALMDTIVSSFPRHTAKKNETLENGEAKAIEADGECAIFVFKTVVDQYGKQTMFKVMNGELKKDTMLNNVTSGSSEKFGHIYIMKGKKQIEVDSLVCGDIGVVQKLNATKTNDTLTAGAEIKYKKTEFPTPYMCKAIMAAAKGGEDKITQGIARLLEEDPAMVYENNAETKQMLIYGMSDIHLDVIFAKLKNRYGANLVTAEPKIAYRETINGTVEIQGKHKKQSGGSGQYGDVRIRFSHGEEEGLTFTQSVVGGSVPKNFYPAVEKGLLEAMQKGVLAGFPVVNLAADLYDGSYHPVDSNEISFKLAAKIAYKEGLPKARPVLLEPYGSLKVSVPEYMVGDVMGDLNKRRGRVLGMNPDEKRSGYTIVEAEAPKAEMMDYTIILKAMTQGRGKYTFTFDHYEEVPGNEAQKIIAAHQNDDED